MLSLVVAMARNRVIGCDNRLPWRLPDDLKRFRRITWGKPVVMGRKTHESIGRPLPERTNIIITHDRNYQAKGCIVVHSLAEALAVAEPAEEVMITGGETLYRQTLDRAQRIYLTHVEADVVGDTRFPELDPKLWREVRREAHPTDEKHAYAHTFIVLERVSNCTVTF